jgi:hypothetical protein
MRRAAASLARRAQPLVLTVGVLVALCAQPARADGGPPPPGASVTVAPSGGGAARSLTLAELSARFDVHAAAYTVREADGATSSVAVGDGISLTALLAAAGLDADAFDYIEVAGADGSSAIVLRDDLGGTDEGPPAVWADDAGVHLLRPSKGKDDVNAGDLVTLADRPLAIALKTGEPLVPRIQVAPLRARPHERVDFSASLAAGRLGPGMRYEWYFDGTGIVHGANVSHRFSRPGIYLVLLYVVRGSGETVGATETVRVHVVRAREPRRSDAHGSDDSRDGGADAIAGGGGGAGSGAVGEGTGGGTPSSAGSAAPSPAVVPPEPASAPRRARTPRRAPRGDRVSGTLIASASAALASAGGARAAHAAARGAASDGPLQLPVGAWVAAGLLALLALGWVLESRHTIPFWQP